MKITQNKKNELVDRMYDAIVDRKDTCDTAKDCADVAISYFNELLGKLIEEQEESAHYYYNRDEECITDEQKERSYGRADGIKEVIEELEMMVNKMEGNIITK